MSENVPKGELSTRTLAMPKDTNVHGDIFGGWLMSQMDIAGSLVASKRIKSKVVTVAVDGFIFHEPVSVGDVLCCYGEIIKIGNTSITIKVEAFVVRKFTEVRIKVTEGQFTFVNIGDGSKPLAIKDEYKKL